MFFFEKKNQKTFICWSLMETTIPNCSDQCDKSFLLLFFKKEDLLLALPSFL